MNYDFRLLLCVLYIEIQYKIQVKYFGFWAIFKN